jgi:hypothetical protein
MINTGIHIGSVIVIETDLEELAETSLSQMLIDKDYISAYCNDNEYTVISTNINIDN